MSSIKVTFLIFSLSFDHKQKPNRTTLKSIIYIAILVSYDIYIVGHSIIPQSSKFHKIYL